MIIVTGATGQLGRLVVQQLLTRVPAEEVGVSVRDPDKARDLEPRGVRARRGDFSDAASMASALEGATKVLIVSAGGTGDTAVAQHRTAISAAVSAGAQRVVYTSQMGSSPTSAFAPMPDHAATEAILAECGTAFTSLRNGFYASSGAMLLTRSGALQTGRLAVPEDGPVAWTTHADLAEAAAIALTEDALDGITPVLTATETVDMTGMAAIASELTGRQITRVVVPATTSTGRDGGPRRTGRGGRPAGRAVRRRPSRRLHRHRPHPAATARALARADPRHPGRRSSDGSLNQRAPGSPSGRSLRSASLRWGGPCRHDRGDWTPRQARRHPPRPDRRLHRPPTPAISQRR